MCPTKLCERCARGRVRVPCDSFAIVYPACTLFPLFIACTLPLLLFPFLRYFLSFPLPILPLVQSRCSELALCPLSIRPFFANSHLIMESSPLFLLLFFSFPPLQSTDFCWFDVYRGGHNTRVPSLLIERREEMK